MRIDSPMYRKAFERYLRYGIPIEVQRKATEHPTTHYIWTTRGDDKVRPPHAAREGQVFAWDDPSISPPGTEPGCRCTAVPYYGPVPYDPPIEPVYPIESLIAIAGGGGVLRVLLPALVRSIRDVDARTLTETQIRNLSRFDKKLPKDAGVIHIIRGPNGQRIFQADVPAKNIPGSFARYEKIVDKAGNTISYTKTTYARDGRIIHRKIK